MIWIASLPAVQRDRVWWPGWGRTNDRPIMSPEGIRPTRSSDVDPNTNRPRPRPTNPPTSGKPHPIGSQDWQSTLSTVGGRLPESFGRQATSTSLRTSDMPVRCSMVRSHSGAAPWPVRQALRPTDHSADDLAPQSQVHHSVGRVERHVNKGGSRGGPYGPRRPIHWTLDWSSRRA